jgi:hypothetical protein
MPLTNLGSEIDFALTACDGDVVTFKHADGHSFKVRLAPLHLPTGGYALYEVWHREPSTASRLRRLLTERGYEIVFELPLLLERKLEPMTGASSTLMTAFFEEMRDETFKNYPRELFK